MKMPIVVGLDNQRLSGLPKLDPRRVVLDYVKSQRVFAKHYAKEGQVVMNTWLVEENTNDLQSLNPPEVFLPPTGIGFATPVLCPRVPKLQSTIVLKDTKKEISISNTSQFSAKRRLSKKQKVAQSKQDFATSEVDTKIISRLKRTHQSDEYHRLNERQERKRVKRNIMQPEEDKPSSKKYKGKKQSVKAKLPAGLALMHGFTATNVGKNRLTIDPPVRRGVFGRGKSSHSVNVAKLSAKKGGADNHETRKSPVKTRRGFSSDSISQSENIPSKSREVRFSPKVQPKITKKDERIKLPRKNSIQTPTPSPETLSLPQAKYFRKEESITWDIEKEDGTLPSESSSLQDSQPRASTLLVHVSRPEWLVSAQTNEAPISSSTKRTTNHGPAHSSGTRPSKSASPPLFTPSNSYSKINMEITQELIHSRYFEHPEPTKPDLANVSISLGIKATRDILGAVPDDNVTLKENIGTEKLSPPRPSKSPHIIQDGLASDWLFGDVALSPNLQAEGDYTWISSPHSVLSHTHGLGVLASIPEYSLDQDGYFDAWNPHQNECEAHNEYQHDLGLPYFDYDEESLLHSYDHDSSRSFTSVSSRNWKPDSCGQSDFSVNRSHMSLEHTEISSLDGSQAILVEETPTLTFTEGRRLLISCSIKQQSRHIIEPPSAEVDMANILVGHWKPQKY